MPDEKQTLVVGEPWRTTLPAGENARQPATMRWVGLFAALAAASAASAATKEAPGKPPAPSTVPEQLHTAIAGKSSSNGDATGFNVVWFTASSAPSVVKFGTAPGSLTAQAHGTSESYLDGWGYHHTVDVLGLHPSTAYFYAVGDGTTMSAVQRYKMTPGAATTEAFNMSIFGDMGYEGSAERPMIITISGLKKQWSAVPTRHRLASMQTAGEIDAIWHVGDIGYIDDAFAHDPLHFVYEEAYNGYMNWLQVIDLFPLPFASCPLPLLLRFCSIFLAYF